MPEVKKILEIFREAFLKLKKFFCLRHLVLIFDQRKNSLNSIAVSIRVKTVDFNIFKNVGVP
jgi:hypothetical protein